MTIQNSHASTFEILQILSRAVHQISVNRKENVSHLYGAPCIVFFNFPFQATAFSSKLTLLDFESLMRAIHLQPCVLTIIRQFHYFLLEMTEN